MIKSKEYSLNNDKTILLSCIKKGFKTKRGKLDTVSHLTCTAGLLSYKQKSDHHVHLTLVHF